MSYKWVVVIIFMLFTLFHNIDKNMIGYMTDLIMSDFKISHTEMGLVFTGALIISVVFQPLWGYLFDKYARNKLIALASLIWGFTTWLSILPRDFLSFLAARTSTGVDDLCYPGINSMLSDYFKPQERGKAYGIVSSAVFLGTLLGGIVALIVGRAMGWRTAYYLTGATGIVMALLIYLLVKEPFRGISEPEMEGLETISTYKLSLEKFRSGLKRKTVIFLWLQNFFGIFPWQILTFWMFKYLLDIRMFSESYATILMTTWIGIMFLGNILGGVIGDLLFKYWKKGRVAFCCIIAFLSGIIIYIAISASDPLCFIILACIASLLLPMAGPNVTATFYDVLEPEVRSVVPSIGGIFSNMGGAFAPLVAGVLADIYGLSFAIMIPSMITWFICSIFFLLATLYVEKDMEALRRVMRERAMLERQKSKHEDSH